ncbi:unnamed protein product [Closterium sp. Naga37s-1]|nr:unnamed protein product [Closterium sp. Naga37s-1]
MRADVCSLAAGELFVQLYMEEIVVPLQPITVVGEEDVLMFPKEEDVRLELARLSRERTYMELDGFVMASVVMSIAKALGYNVHELRAACAHELSTCGTPLLIRSPTAENYAERQAAQETLADMLHESPEPLPPAPAIWARQHQEETGAHLKARKESTETQSPDTPDATPEKGRVGGMRKPRAAAAKAKACPGTGEKKRGGTSEYTGVWKNTLSKVMEQSVGEMAALEGCIEDDVRHLVHKRQWYPWREWRKAMDDIGVKPGTPFELEKNGKGIPQTPRHDTSVDAPGEAGDAEGESVEVSPGEGSDGEAVDMRTP